MPHNIYLAHHTSQSRTSTDTAPSLPSLPSPPCPACRPDAGEAMSSCTLSARRALMTATGSSNRQQPAMATYDYQLLHSIKELYSVCAQLCGPGGHRSYGVCLVINYPHGTLNMHPPCTAPGQSRAQPLLVAVHGHQYFQHAEKPVQIARSLLLAAWMALLNVKSNTSPRLPSNGPHIFMHHMSDAAHTAH
jgi:hypothetical protein